MACNCLKAEQNASSGNCFQHVHKQEGTNFLLIRNLNLSLFWEPYIALCPVNGKFGFTDPSPTQPNIVAYIHTSFHSEALSEKNEKAVRIYLVMLRLPFMAQSTMMGNITFSMVAFQR